MTDLDPSILWSHFLDVTVELGTGVDYVPIGAAWGLAKWGVDTWGYRTWLAQWREVTADILAVEVDTGRSGVLDPGDVARATFVLSDRGGAHGLAGSKTAVGSVGRVRARRRAGGEWEGLFWGKVVEASAAGDLVAPVVTLRLDDALGAVLAVDDVVDLPAESVTARLNRLLDRGDWPAELRDIQDDPTALLAVEAPLNRLDAARAAVASAGGTLLADGDGVIVYRDRNLALPPDMAPKYEVGTPAGVVSPGAMVLNEARDNVRNAYAWKTAADPPLEFEAADASSIARYGRRNDVRSDLLNVDPVDLEAVGARELYLTAWPGERVEGLEFTVADDPSADLTAVAIGDLVLVTYTGSDPWSRIQMVGGFAQRFDPAAWRIVLRTFDALVLSTEEAATWGLSRWGTTKWRAAA